MCQFWSFWAILTAVTFQIRTLITFFSSLSQPITSSEWEHTNNLVSLREAHLLVPNEAAIACWYQEQAKSCPGSCCISGWFCSPADSGAHSTILSASHKLPHRGTPTWVSKAHALSLGALQKACLLRRVGAVDRMGGYRHTFPSPGYTIDIKLATWFICVVQWNVGNCYMCHIWTKALQVILGFATIHFPLSWTQMEMSISSCVPVEGPVQRWGRLSPVHNR